MNNGLLDLSTLPALLTQTLYGYLWLVRFVLVVLALVLLWWMTRKQPEVIVEQVPQRTPTLTRTGPLRLQQAGLPAKTTATIKTVAESASLHTTTEPLQRYTPLWLLLAFLLICTYALTENATGAIQPHATATVISGLSLIAQCIWFGGLTYLGYVALPLLSIVDLDSNAETIVTFLRRMTPFITGAIGVQIVSLLFLSETTVSTPNLLLDDPYGRSLLVRLALVALILLASVYILFVLRPKLARQSALLAVVDADLPARRKRQSTLERTIRHVKMMVNLQGLVGAGILLCAALMSFYAPPIVFPKTTYANPPATATAIPSDTTQQQKVGNFTVGLQVSPARVTSANTVIVSLTDATGKSVTNAKVEFISNMQTMDMGTAIKKATLKGTTYVATFESGEAFSMTGLWNIEVRFQLPTQSVQKAEFQVTVGE
jgi:putative copper export protein